MSPQPPFCIIPRGDHEINCSYIPYSQVRGVGWGWWGEYIYIYFRALRRSSRSTTQNYYVFERSGSSCLQKMNNPSQAVKTVPLLLRSRSCSSNLYPLLTRDLLSSIGFLFSIISLLLTEVIISRDDNNITIHDIPSFFQDFHEWRGLAMIIFQEFHGRRGLGLMTCRRRSNVQLLFVASMRCNPSHPSPTRTLAPACTLPQPADRHT